VQAAERDELNIRAAVEQLAGIFWSFDFGNSTQNVAS
jgi:hypothetical protein